MESRNDADGHDDIGTALARLGDMNAAASSEPRSASPTFRTPVEVFNLEVEALLEGGELPALDILFSQTPVGFNYHSMIKSVIPMTFGQKGKDHVSPEPEREGSREPRRAPGRHEGTRRCGRRTHRKPLHLDAGASQNASRGQNSARQRVARKRSHLHDAGRRE